jgi:hypothetical protein
VSRLVKDSLIGMILLLLFSGSVFADVSEERWKAAPFAVANPNPFILIHGLPVTATARLLPGEAASLQLQVDLANNSIRSSAGGESISLDGETYRARLIWKLGLHEGWQVGIELPLIKHSSGALDGFIENWHDLFGLTNSDRAPWPKNRLRYSYERGGVTEVELTDNSSGLGDMQLLASRALFESASGGELTLNASLKLPTGDADRLLGSGAAELALWVNGTLPGLMPQWGLGGFMQAGALAMEQGDVLPDLQRTSVWFGGVGAYWQATNWLVVKSQVDAHGSFYSSKLSELGSDSVMLTLGGTILMDQGRSAVDLAIGENLITDTIPDFMINMAYKTRF